jgi:hypothetical protein
MPSAAAYRRDRRRKRCSRCGRRRARPGRTKCSPCAKALKVTDSRGARRRKYGASPADVAALIESQNGRCPICGKWVDHTDALDHAHGEHGPDALRGVLCKKDNAAIGGSDEELFVYAQNIGAYASKRHRVLIRRECVVRCRAA